MALDPSRRTRPTVLNAAAPGIAATAPPAAASGGARPLPRTHPEAVGILSAAIAAFVDAAEQKLGGLHSFMLLRHGQVAAEGWWAPYAPRHPHMLFSLSKSFTSTAIGLAVDEGRLAVNAPVLSFFTGDAPAEISENLAAMQVRHLLSMSTGHDKDATGPTTRAPDGNWVRAFLALPVEHEPGTHFAYNSAATYVLSAILQKLTGQTVLEYLRPRLFDPLGIQNPTWENCPRGINVGGWGLSITTEAIARFGQLYLQSGQWQGHQLVPESWIEEATRKQVSNGTNENSDWAQGYGYQFWRSRHGAYRGDGAFGQFCIVMPSQEAVLAITSGVGDLQAALNLVWGHLLPAMQSGPIPATEAAADLPRKLSQLAVRLPEGHATSPTADRVSGKTYRFEANEEKIASATLTFKGSRCTLALRDERGDHPIEVEHGAWAYGTATLGDRGPAKVAASSAWSDDDTFTMKLCFYEAPFIQTITCRFAGDTITVNRKTNVGFGPTERPPLTGELA